MTDSEKLVESASQIADEAAILSNKAVSLAEQALNIQTQTNQIIVSGVDPFVYAITIFILACFVGYYVVWKVTPALHTPLMSVTNAVSSIIIVGALLAAATGLSTKSGLLGLIAVTIASINIFGGFIVTHRMLQMFNRKKKVANNN